MNYEDLNLLYSYQYIVFDSYDAQKYLQTPFYCGSIKVTNQTLIHALFLQNYMMINIK